MADSNIGESFDWDEAEIADDGGFVLLPEGIYAFGVEKLERERFEGSAKMAACPRAHLTLSIVGADGTSGTVHERLMLNTKVAWRVARFFKSLGFAESPETGKVPMAWNRVEGMGGYLKLAIRKYKKHDGSEGESNEVAEFLLPGDERIAQFARAQGAPQPAAPQPAPQAQAAPYQAAMPVPQQPAQTAHPGWQV